MTWIAVRIAAAIIALLIARFLTFVVFGDEA